MTCFGPALLVEVEIVFVAGAAVFTGPYPQAGARIAREDRDRVALLVGAFDVEGMIEAAVVGRMEAGVVGVLGQRCAGTRSERQGGDARDPARDACRRRRTRGRIRRAPTWMMRGSRAAARSCLRERRDRTRGRRDGSRNSAPRCRAGAPARRAVRGDGDSDLCAQAFVGAEQGHVAVCGGAGDDLDHAAVGERAEADDDVAVEGFELLERVGEEALPEASGLSGRRARPWRGRRIRPRGRRGRCVEVGGNSARKTGARVAREGWARD